MGFEDVKSTLQLETELKAVCNKTHTITHRDYAVRASPIIKTSWCKICLDKQIWKNYCSALSCLNLNPYLQTGNPADVLPPEDLPPSAGSVPADSQGADGSGAAALNVTDQNLPDILDPGKETCYPLWYDLSVPFMITSPHFRQMVFSFRSQMCENSLCTKQLTLDNKRKMHIKGYSILKHLNLLVNKNPFYVIELVSESIVI